MSNERMLFAAAIMAGVYADQFVRGKLSDGPPEEYLRAMRRLYPELNEWTLESIHWAHELALKEVGHAVKAMDLPKCQGTLDDESRILGSLSQRFVFSWAEQHGWDMENACAYGASCLKQQAIDYGIPMDTLPEYVLRFTDNGSKQ